jgi:hypothetical protein
MILINSSLAHPGTVALKAFHGLIRFKDSSRDFLENCAISFFRLRILLHAYVQTVYVMGGGKKKF